MMDPADDSGHASSCPRTDEVVSSVYDSEKDTNDASTIDSQPPPPLLFSATSSHQPEVGSCHVTSPVATAAIWAAVLPARSGGDFDSGRFPSTAEQCRGGGNYVCGDELSAERLSYRDVIYPESYQDTADAPAWSTAGPYYPRIGGPPTADLPPVPPHHQPLIMSSCDPTAYQVIIVIIIVVFIVIVMF